MDEVLAADEDLRNLAAHHLRLAIECVLDVCRHYLAVKGVSLHELVDQRLGDFDELGRHALRRMKHGEQRGC